MFEGKVAIVFGGDSGIGAATSELLGDRGAQVVISALSLGELSESLCEKISQAGGKAVAMQCDVTERDAVYQLFEDVVDRFGAVDVVVNSAGLAGRTPAFDADIELVTQLINVNLMGAINVVHAALKAMKSRRGAIVNVTSTQAALGEVGFSVYAATKAAIEQFTSTLVPELKGMGIRVNCLGPGPVKTAMTQATHSPTTPEGEKILETLNSNGKGPYSEFFMEAMEVARTIVFLASDHASAIHGATVVADQGHTSAHPVIKI